MTRCCEILNNINTVNVLVSALRIPGVLPDLCIIAHHLLLSDRLALHKCRYSFAMCYSLDSLTLIKPRFLGFCVLWFSNLAIYNKQLLVHIKSEKQFSLFGSSDTSLILLLAKGVHLTPSESQRIVPVLDVFCSLFSHLLVTLDDSEFYNESGS